MVLSRLPRRVPDGDDFHPYVTSSGLSVTLTVGSRGIVRGHCVVFMQGVQQRHPYEFYPQIADSWWGLILMTACF